MRLSAAVVLLALPLTKAFGQGTDDSLQPKFTSVLSMTGDGWAMYPDGVLPWESGDVVFQWIFFRASGPDDRIVLCEDTILLTIQDTLLLDGGFLDGFEIMKNSGLFDSLGEEAHRLYRGSQMGIPPFMTTKSEPNVRCADKMFWKLHFSGQMVLLFRASAQRYGGRRLFSYTEKEIPIGVIINNTSPFAELVRKKFDGR